MRSAVEGGQFQTNSQEDARLRDFFLRREEGRPFLSVKGWTEVRGRER